MENAVSMKLLLSILLIGFPAYGLLTGRIMVKGGFPSLYRMVDRDTEPKTFWFFMVFYLALLGILWFVAPNR